MRFIAILALLVAVQAAPAQAQDPFENLERTGADAFGDGGRPSDPAPVAPAEDPGLQRGLLEAAALRSQRWVRGYGQGGLVFVILSNPFIKEHLEREKKDGTGYVDFVRRFRGTRVAVRAYTLDGKSTATIHFDKTALRDPARETSLEDSMVVGFVYRHADFPLNYEVLRKAYDKNQVAVVYGDDGTVSRFIVPHGEVCGYVLRSKFGADRRQHVVSVRSLPGDAKAWLPDTVHGAFYKFFVCDNRQELVTTDERMRGFGEKVQSWIDRVKALRRSVRKVWQEGRDSGITSWWSAEGEYLKYDKQWREADDFMYKSPLETAMAGISNDVSADTVQKHAALIFGRNAIKEDYVQARIACSNAVTSFGVRAWQETVSDLDPDRVLLKPFNKATDALSKLRSDLAGEYRLHKDRLSKYHRAHGEVLVGYGDIEDLTAHQDYAVD